jgi:hypothetical protein
MDIFTTIGISGVTFTIIAGLANWLGLIQINRIKSKEDHAFSKALEEIKSQLSIQINQQNTAFNLYFTGQFSIYSELWSSITELKNSVDELWEHVDSKNIRSFVNSVRNAKIKVEKAAPFIDDKHYGIINEFFRAIDDYRIGKEKLLYLRQTNDDSVHNDIQHFINNNGKIRQNVHAFSKACLIDFKNKLKG